MHAVCVCVCVCLLLQALCIFGLNCFLWRGCPMQSNATVELPFDRHKVVMDITFGCVV